MNQCDEERKREGEPKEDRQRSDDRILVYSPLGPIS